ncbi:MAG: hypothetical protein JXN61_04135, partial [Sedimentisphaerales bacterium]|nr:hypothetical protein [Sedimentisphaerales bacterium]
GSGKTTWLVHLGQQIHRLGWSAAAGERHVAVWWFCTEGQLPAYMASPQAVGCQDVLLIKVPGSFKYNRYKAPPGVDQMMHLQKLTVQDRECFYFRDYITNMARNACFELSNRQGIFNERQLVDHIQAQRFKPGSRDSMSRESLLNRLQEDLQFMGSVHDTTRSHDLAALTRRSVVWMLNGLSADHINTFVGDLLLFLQEYMPVCYKPTIALVLIMDELTHICTIERCKRADVAEPFMLNAARTLRKRAVGMVVGTQSIFTVPSVILSNLSAFCIGYRPNDSFSKRILSDQLALDREQTDYMMEMPEREVVCRTKDCPRTFLGNVGEINLPLATQEQIAERVEETDCILQTLLEPEPEPPSLFSQTTAVDQPPAVFDYYNLTKTHWDYLEFLAQPAHLLMPLGRLDELSSHSQYKANLIRQQLIEAGPGLIRIHRIKTGKKGGPLSVIEITQAGYSLLSKLAVDCKQPVGHGGIEHLFWQHTIYRWAIAKGYPAKIEQWLSNKSVDIGVEWAEKKVAVEVALDNMEKEISNLIKDLEAGWDQVVFAVLSEKELNQLKNEIARRFGADLMEKNRVAFMMLNTFLETNDSQGDEDE